MPVDVHRNDCSFPPNVPELLIRELHEAGSERALSRRLGVNILYVSQLLQKGIEPTNKTANGRKIRKVLGLDKPTKRTKIQKAISKMARATKKSLKV